MGRIAYRDAALLMKDFYDNPPLHVLTAMRYGFYEQREKRRQFSEAADRKLIMEAKQRAQTFDMLPPAIQQRVMERLARAKKEGRLPPEVAPSLNKKT